MAAGSNTGCATYLRRICTNATTAVPGHQWTFVTRGAYVGFLTDDGQTRIRSAYPGATWDRLARVKLTYDAINLFRLNQNISPAAK